MASIKSDHYTAGFMTGTVAGMVADFSNFLLTRVFRFGKVGYEDFAAVLVFGNVPCSFGQSIVGHLVQLFFSSMVGALFAFWIQKVSARFLFFKGITFGLLIWFLAFSLAQIYKLQYLHQFDLGTVITNNVAAIIYGAVLGVALPWFYGKLGAK
jgi:hypothetical protein